MAKQILVVEDDEGISEIVDYVLTSNGYHVDSTATVRGFYELLRVKKPDLIILDIRLPDGDGREVCLSVKADNDTSNIPIVLMSAHAHRMEIMQTSYADDFIAKPFDIDYFLERIKGQLSA